MKRTIKDKKNVLNFLTTMKKLNGNQLKEVIEYLKDDAIDGICECVYNILYTDFNLSDSKRKRLKKLIKTKCCTKRLKLISNKKLPISKRRNALKMEGRGLPLLLGAGIPFLINLLTGR